MSGQLITVIVLVALASLYVLRAMYKSITKSGCASGCGKCVSEPPVAENNERIPLKQVR